MIALGRRVRHISPAGNNSSAGFILYNQGMNEVPSGNNETEARLKKVIESYIRTATLSHLRDEEAVRQYIVHQTDACLKALQQMFNIEKK